MHKTHMILCGGILLFLVGSIGYNLYQKNPDTLSNNTVAETGTQTKIQNKYKEQMNEGGGVTVTAKPILVDDSGRWSFELTLQTHSVELDMDLLKAVSLIDANGSEIAPTVWNGDVPGGHHRTGIISFKSIYPAPDTLVLQVKDVAGVEVREFTWQFVQ